MYPWRGVELPRDAHLSPPWALADHEERTLAVVAAITAVAFAPAAAYAAPADTLPRFGGITVHKTGDLTRHWQLSDDAGPSATATTVSTGD
ncbi:hypothetical protein [Streptodolium elevatio]